jgi:3-oxoacyl-[acyl-carrier protein] reductase
MIVESTIARVSGTATPVALVTGASGAIGAAVVTRLAAAGFDVALHCFSHADAADAMRQGVEKQGRRAMVLAADLSSDAGAADLVQRAAAMLGHPTCIIHAATPPIVPTPILLTPPEALEHHVQVHALAFVRLCRAALPAMQRQQTGVIVPILSTVVEPGRPKQWSSYLIGKMALVGAAAAVATDIEGTGVRIVSLMPAAVDTALSRRAGANPTVWLTANAVADVALRIVLEPDIFGNGAVVRLSETSTEVGSFEFVGRSPGRP